MFMQIKLAFIEKGATLCVPRLMVLSVLMHDHNRNYSYIVNFTSLIGHTERDDRFGGELLQGVNVDRGEGRGKEWSRGKGTWKRGRRAKGWMQGSWVGAWGKLCMEKDIHVGEYGKLLKFINHRISHTYR